METPIAVALISSTTSVALAVWSLMTARTAKSRALEAEEMAKRSELVRVKGLDAGAAILRSLTEFMIGAETAIQLIRLSGGLFEEDAQAMGALQVAAQQYLSMRRCVSENAIYLADEITGAVDALVSNVNLSPEVLPARLREARDLHASLVLAFRNIYLSDATVRPHNKLLQQSVAQVNARSARSIGAPAVEQ